MALTAAAYQAWQAPTDLDDYALCVAVFREFELLGVDPIRSFDAADAQVELRWMRGRGSRLPWRRRRAHQACLALIARREYALGLSRKWPAHYTVA